ncbi:MAG: type II toxin-antitoxin system HicB family antitoxin [Thermoproteota archaeon]
MVTRSFTAILEPAEEGGFIVKCVELPVASQGETREEALKNIKETIEGYLEVFSEELEIMKQRREVVEITV